MSHLGIRVLVQVDRLLLLFAPWYCYMLHLLEMLVFMANVFGFYLFIYVFLYFLFCRCGSPTARSEQLSPRPKEARPLHQGATQGARERIRD